jgi:outer membrane lipoprotein-sorting protein
MRRAAALAVLLLLTPGLAPGAETARQILDRRKALTDGPQHWTDRRETLTMALLDGRGGRRERGLTRWERHDGDVTRTLVFFAQPAEVKGTGFLAFVKTGQPAEQWIYLPELRRIRQITARARGESFVGTDLTYHDLDVIQQLGDWTEAQAASTLRGEETIDGVPCWVIGLAPTAEDEPYKRIVLWLGKDDLVPRRLELFTEPDGEPAKRIDQRDVRVVGTVPVPFAIDVATPARGSHTEIRSSEVVFDEGLPDDFFTQATLERGAP